jgi:hypothetical protein
MIDHFYVFVTDSQFFSVQVNFEGVTQHDSITDDFCRSTKDLFGDTDHHDQVTLMPEQSETSERPII